MDKIQAIREPARNAAQAIISMLFLLPLLGTLPSAEAQNDSSSPRIENFSPMGFSKNIRSAVAVFSHPIVPFGEVRDLEEPFVIDCPVPGSARWIGPRRWAYDFEKNLPGGISCTFELRPDVETLDGMPVNGGGGFTFHTGGPSVHRIIPNAGSSAISEEQAFILFLDSESDEDSVEALAGIDVEGVAERIPVAIIDGPDANPLLSSMQIDREKEGPLLVIQARQQFAPLAKLTLVWPAGIVAKGGQATVNQQTFAYRTRPFFIGNIACARSAADSGCFPNEPIFVRFSALTQTKQTAKAFLESDKGKIYRPTVSPSEQWSYEIRFDGPFIENSELTLHLPDDLEDESRRSLKKDEWFDKWLGQKIKVGEYPPLAKFAARFGIIEWRADPTLPLTIRKHDSSILGSREQITTAHPTGLRGIARRLINSITGTTQRIDPDEAGKALRWLRQVRNTPSSQSIFERRRTEAENRIATLSVPLSTDSSESEVVGIPFDQPGLYIVEVASPPLGNSSLNKDEVFYVATAALVTNLAVHFKWGKSNSIAWVTHLDSGTPVSGAELKVHDCHGKVLWSGSSDQEGIAEIPKLIDEQALPNCYQENSSAINKVDHSQVASFVSLDRGLFVTARKNEDFSFVHSSWEQGIQSWRFHLPILYRDDPIVVHTILDRSLVRTGETVSMKHLIRQRTERGLDFVDDSELPTRMTVLHLGSQEKFETKLEWSENGSALSKWQVPKHAKLGHYQVQLWRHDSTGKRFTYPSASIRVEDFVLPVMAGRLTASTSERVRPESLILDLDVSYLSGGGAGYHPVTLRTHFQPHRMSAPLGFEFYNFANGAIETGIRDPGYQEDPLTKFTKKQTITLDRNGRAEAEISELPPVDRPLAMIAAMEFRDTNGETQQTVSSVPIWPSERLVGIRIDNWVGVKSSIQAKIAVVDTKGKAVVGAKVQVKLHKRSRYSTRKRLIGGFHSYEHIEEVSKALETWCEGETDKHGLLICDAPSPVDGEIILQAEVRDAQGRLSIAHGDLWVIGSEESWFESGDSNRIDLLPEKHSYEPGEIARFQVRSPFREGTALVSVEREGILEAFVAKISGKNPVVEVPISKDYAPNVFVSVIVIRGRVDAPAPTSRVDLAKPALRMGIAEIIVGDKAHSIEVELKPERDTYKVRETAVVDIQAKLPSGEPAADGEVVVIAIDKALLELRSNESWDVIEKMIRRRYLGVHNSSAQLQVVGKRHYGRKAQPHGGGGGSQSFRELFDTLLFWSPRTLLDEKGQAQVRIPLNDSLTTFRIVAIATEGRDRFGQGSTEIRSTQDLMILSSLAPLLRTGDVAEPEVTVRNTSTMPMDVVIRAKVDVPKLTLGQQRVKLDPKQAKAIHWDVITPRDRNEIEYSIEAFDSGGTADRAIFRQEIIPAVPVRPWQAQLLQLSPSHEIPVSLPADALPGRGGISLQLSPSIAPGIEATRKWMASYPYNCLEQQVSRAVALKGSKLGDHLWTDIQGRLGSYSDTTGLLKYFPTSREGSDVLTAYVLSITKAAGLDLAPEVEARSASALRDFVEGRIHHHRFPARADLEIRKVAALAALARLSRAKSSDIELIDIQPQLWPTTTVIDWWSFLLHVEDLSARQARITEAEGILRSRLAVHGSTIDFADSYQESFPWLMCCADANILRLAYEGVALQSWQDDLPKIIQGAFKRQRAGRWDCTTSNSWGTLTVERFVNRFEKEAITGRTKVSLGDRTKDELWGSGDPPEGIELPWPQGVSSLRLQHEGEGKPWVMILAEAAVRLKGAVSAGYRIRKTIVPVEQKDSDRYSRGDILRIDLEVDAISDMSWVVIDDAIPAGAGHLVGRGPVTTTGRSSDHTRYPVYIERPFEAYRAYFDFVPQGTFSTSYLIRLNHSGTFQQPPTRVEALYAPEMFGEIPNPDMVIVR